MILVRNQIPLIALVLCGVLFCWLVLFWLITDSCHPVAMLTMPMSPVWTVGNLIAVFAMWVVMMIAMMLPSALPMILMHHRMAKKNSHPFENLSFTISYLFIWVFFFSYGCGFAIHRSKSRPIRSSLTNHNKNNFYHTTYNGWDLSIYRT
jgi:ABC-type multidrug transport system fused ATPase/permease subunit